MLARNGQDRVGPWKGSSLFRHHRRRGGDSASDRRNRRRRTWMGRRRPQSDWRSDRHRSCQQRILKRGGGNKDRDQFKCVHEARNLPFDPQRRDPHSLVNPINALLSPMMCPKVLRTSTTSSAIAAIHIIAEKKPPMHRTILHQGLLPSWALDNTKKDVTIPAVVIQGIAYIPQG